MPGNNKTFDDIITMAFYNVILYFRLRLGNKSRKSQLLCFLSDLREIWYGGNFEMLITKGKPKLKSENDLSKKLQFSTDFSQNFTVYSEFKPISI